MVWVSDGTVSLLAEELSHGANADVVSEVDLSGDGGYKAQEFRRHLFEIERSTNSDVEPVRVVWSQLSALAGLDEIDPLIIETDVLNGKFARDVEVCTLGILILSFFLR